MLACETPAPNATHNIDGSPYNVASPCPLLHQQFNPGLDFGAMSAISGIE